jgi:hypothetical protein
VLGGLGGVSNDIGALERLGVRPGFIGSGLTKVALGASLRSSQALAARRFDYVARCKFQHPQRALRDNPGRRTDDD